MCRLDNVYVSFFSKHSFLAAPPTTEALMTEEELEEYEKERVAYYKDIEDQIAAHKAGQCLEYSQSVVKNLLLNVILTFTLHPNMSTPTILCFVHTKRKRKGMRFFPLILDIT